MNSMLKKILFSGSIIAVLVASVFAYSPAHNAAMGLSDSVYGLFGANITPPRPSTGGGTPGGDPGDIQYNDSGAFGGISGVTSDGSTVIQGLNTFLKGTLTDASTVNLIGTTDAFGGDLVLMGDFVSGTPLTFGVGNGADNTFANLDVDYFGLYSQSATEAIQFVSDRATATFQSQYSTPNAFSTGVVHEYNTLSGVPANADILQNFKYQGNNSILDTKSYGRFSVTATSVTSGAEYGTLNWYVLDNGIELNPITITGTTSQFKNSLEILKVDAGATGAIFDFYHDSSSPAANDEIGILNYYGKDSAGNKTKYADITGLIVSPTNGAESGGVIHYAALAGTRTEVMRWGNLDANFRGLAVGTVTPIDPSGLNVTRGQFYDSATNAVVFTIGGGANSSYSTFALFNAGATGEQIRMGIGATYGSLQFTNKQGLIRSTAALTYDVATASSHIWSLNNVATELARLNSTGLTVGSSSAGTVSKLAVYDVGTNPVTFDMRDGDITAADWSGVFTTPALSSNIIFRISNASSASGGTGLNGFTSGGTNNGNPIFIFGYHGGSGTITTPAVIIGGWKHNGATSRTALVTTEPVWEARTGATTILQQLANGSIGTGTVGTISAFLHVVGTTEQLRLGYDASNYLSTTISSAGAVTFNAVGASQGFTFSDGVNITGSIQVDSVVNDTGLAHGTYTPTLTNGTNVASSTPYPAQYMRVGNTVTVSGQVFVEPTANNTQTTLGISLPVASNLANAYECAGTGYKATNGSAGHGAGIQADQVNNRCEIDYYETHGTGGDLFSFTFTYLVI